MLKSSLIVMIVIISFVSHVLTGILIPKLKRSDEVPGKQNSTDDTLADEGMKSAKKTSEYKDCLINGKSGKCLSQSGGTMIIHGLESIMYIPQKKPSDGSGGKPPPGRPESEESYRPPYDNYESNETSNASYDSYESYEFDEIKAASGPGDSGVQVASNCNPVGFLAFLGVAPSLDSCGSNKPSSSVKPENPQLFDGSSES